jgi:hypothetical protein
MIILTSLKNKSKIYINPIHIGHFYEVEELIEYGSVTIQKHTVVGVTTHNNGGFKVTETAKQIDNYIKKNTP